MTVVLWTEKHRSSIERTETHLKLVTIWRIFPAHFARERLTQARVLFRESYLEKKIDQLETSIFISVAEPQATMELVFNRVHSLQHGATWQSVTARTDQQEVGQDTPKC